MPNITSSPFLTLSDEELSDRFAAAGEQLQAASAALADAERTYAPVAAEAHRRLFLKEFPDGHTVKFCPTEFENGWFLTAYSVYDADGELLTDLVAGDLDLDDVEADLTAAHGAADDYVLRLR